jgi:hypothetical protein
MAGFRATRKLETGGNRMLLTHAHEVRLIQLLPTRQLVAADFLHALDIEEKNENLFEGEVLFNQKEESI